LGAGVGFEPILEFLQACIAAAVSEIANSADAQIGAQKLRELREVIEAWSKLSPELRTAVRAVTRCAKEHHA